MVMGGMWYGWDVVWVGCGRGGMVWAGCDRIWYGKNIHKKKRLQNTQLKLYHMDIFLVKNESCQSPPFVVWWAFLS